MCTDPRRLAAVVGTALLLIAGCGTAPAPVTTEPTVQTPDAATRPAETNTLETSFEEVAATIPATVGIAITPVGGTTTTTFGSWSAGVAWSTIKVPLAIAALQGDRSNVKPLVAKAITQSDNTAAEQLWSKLGPPDRAAQRVQEILREGGDPTTVVESRRLRPGFTAFGQTQWNLGLQARFAAHLPCLSNAAGVVDLMHNLVDPQRWGLAADGSAAKGGWGPGLSDDYLVRQFGIVSTPAGELGVALAAEPNAGTFAAGVDAVNRMTGWLTTHKAELPGGSCTR